MAMSLALKIREVKECIARNPANPIRAHLLQQLQEFVRTGKTRLLVDDGREQKLVEFRTEQQLAITLLQVSMLSNTYAILDQEPEGTKLSYVLGDIAHKFRIDGTTVALVINLEASEKIKGSVWGKSSLGISEDGGLKPDLIAGFVDRFDTDLHFIENPTIKSQLPRGEELLDALVFDYVIAELAVARLACKKRILSGTNLRILLPPAFSPFPKIGLMRLLTVRGFDGEFRDVLFSALGIKGESEIAGLSDEMIRAALLVYNEVIVLANSHPSISALITNADVAQLHREVFGR